MRDRDGVKFSIRESVGIVRIVTRCEFSADDRRSKVMRFKDPAVTLRDHGDLKFSVNRHTLPGLFKRFTYGRDCVGLARFATASGHRPAPLLRLLAA